MCLGSKPAQPALKEEPKRGDAARNSTLDARRRASSKTESIFTSALGDATYGSNAGKPAALGGSGSDRAPA